MQPLENIYPLLQESRNVVITTHQKPDADALGSSLALYHFLQQLKHHITVISPTNWPDFLNWLPDCNKVIDFEANTSAATLAIDKADWIFCLDFNVLTRTKKMENKLLESKAVKILIDHHREPQEGIFHYGKSDNAKSSTAEMVYDFIIDSGHTDRINEPICECLYAGVMTDTGSFRFNSSSSSVHQMVSHLKELGLNHSRIHEDLYDNFLENRFRFIGHILLNRMDVLYEYNTALIVVPQSDLFKFDVRTGDTEGLVNYPLSIKGIKLAAVIIDRGEERKSSFRSKGDFDVNSFAKKYFNGGGHFNAAGGFNKEPLEEVVQQFKKAIKENAASLTSYQF